MRDGGTAALNWLGLDSSYEARSVSYSAKYLANMRRMTYHAWVERFIPLQNPFDRNAGLDGCLLLPCGKEWQVVRSAPDGCVWTLIITDLIRTSVMHITAGIHVVNREGYLVTKLPSNARTTYSIRY